MNKRTGLLGLFLLAFSAMASASTIVWSLSGPDTDVGLHNSYTSGGLTITAYGFSAPVIGATDGNAQLYGKNDAPDDLGLGLDLANDAPHEITGTGFVQLDISQLVGKVTDFMFMMDSVTPPDGWKVLGSNTLGTPGVVLGCTVTNPCPAGSTDETTHTISPFPVGVYKYLSWETTAGTVLLKSVSADTNNQNPAPEPATLALTGLGLLGVGVLGRRRQTK
jgi:hypothetical protein